MTGAYFFAIRDGKREPVEIEFLTTEEREDKLSEQPPEFLLSCIELLCRTLQECITEYQSQPPPAPHP